MVLLEGIDRDCVAMEYALLFAEDHVIARRVVGRETGLTVGFKQHRDRESKCTLLRLYLFGVSHSFIGTPVDYMIAQDMAEADDWMAFLRNVNPGYIKAVHL